MDITQILQNIFTYYQSPDAWVKTALIALLVLFFIFTLVIGRQISRLLDLVDQVTFSPIFRFIAYGLSFVTLLLLLAVIFV